MNQFALLGLSDSANAVLMYEKFGTARLAYNWRDEFLAEQQIRWFNTNPGLRRGVRPDRPERRYDFNENLAFSFEAINLTGEDVRWHGRSEKQLVRLEDQSRAMLSAPATSSDQNGRACRPSRSIHGEGRCLSAAFSQI